MSAVDSSDIRNLFVRNDPGYPRPMLRRESPYRPVIISFEEVPEEPESRVERIVQGSLILVEADRAVWV
jgi:hypothetical protein